MIISLVNLPPAFPDSQLEEMARAIRDAVRDSEFNPAHVVRGGTQILTDDRTLVVIVEKHDGDGASYGWRTTIGKRLVAVARGYMPQDWMIVVAGNETCVNTTWGVHNPEDNGYRV
jgi:hypothetical protein